MPNVCVTASTGSFSVLEIRSVSFIVDTKTPPRSRLSAVHATPLVTEDAPALRALGGRTKRDR